MYVFFQYISGNLSKINNLSLVHILQFFFVIPSIPCTCSTFIHTRWNGYGYCFSLDRKKTFELILKIYDFKPNSFIHIFIFDKTNKIKRKATPTDKMLVRRPLKAPPAWGRLICSLGGVWITLLIITVYGKSQ